MKRACLTGLAIVLAVHLPASAAMVLLSSPDPALSAAKVEDDFKLIGLMGDFVDLPPGEHHLRIAAPRDYALLVDLQVSDTMVTVGAFRAEPGNCKPNYAVDWQQPTIQTAAQKVKSKAKKARPGIPSDAEHAPTAPPANAGHWILVVAAPVFGSRSSSGSCAMPSMLSCNQSLLIVDFRSTPPGAEIWVGDRRVGVTNATLSVPYCPSWEKKKDVLLRLSGHRNCAMQLAVVGDGKRVPMGCDMAEMP